MLMPERNKQEDKKEERKGKRKIRGKKQKVVKLENLKQLNLNAAGIDIGSEEIWVAVPEGRDEATVRKFESFTIDLYSIAEWLEECRVETIAMESTGVYWIALYEILESKGFEVYLVNARHTKNVSGRKDDIEDSQWIQQLHTYGLLKASFRPEDEIVALRAYARHRANLVRYRSVHIQHMQKALDQMNVKLNKVMRDITGQTGMDIMRDIVAGERDAVILAHHRNPRCSSSEEKIAKALQGNYRPEHVFALKQALELYDFYNQKIKDCDQELEKAYRKFSSQIDSESPPLTAVGKRTGKKVDYPQFDLRTHLYQISGVDLTAINGINVLTAQTIISEIGVDMSKFPTAKHFSSWLGLVPNNKISGGKVLERGTKKTNNRVNTALRLAAATLGRSEVALGAFYRRKKAQHGSPKAITATAHKLARIVYHMLKYKSEYKDPGADYYEQQYRSRVIKNLERKAKKLGLELVPSVS